MTKNKYEILISKFETISNVQNSNFQKKTKNTKQKFVLICAIRVPLFLLLLLKLTDFQQSNRGVVDWLIS